MLSLQVSGIGKKFGEVSAVDDVSFSVKRGSLTTLLGPSGCGKTTTLRLLAGLERPDEGEIRIGDEIVASPKTGVFVPIESRNVGMVFQSYALWPHMKVFEQVAYPLRVRHLKSAEIRKRVLSTLELVQLMKQKDRYPAELSGGQQQRVALARALVFDPAVLFLDEPLSNLDASLRDRMCLELDRLHQQTGMTMVYVTHDQAEALSLSDQVVLMHQGEVIDHRPPAEIYDDPRSAEKSKFVGVANVLAGRVAMTDVGGRGVVLRGGRQLTVDARRIGGNPVGSDVHVLIRPEDIRVYLRPAPIPAPNLIPGVVRQTVYLGPHYQFVVDVDGDLLRVTVPKQWGDAQQNLTGQSVDLNIEPDVIRLFGEHAGSSPHDGTVPGNRASAGPAGLTSPDPTKVSAR